MDRPKAETLSRQVHEHMRKGIARMKLFEIHVLGDAKKGNAGCPQCRESNDNPMRVRQYCDQGRELLDPVYDSIAEAFMAVCKVRRAIDHPTRTRPGPLDLSAEIRNFYDFEFIGDLAPSQRAQKVRGQMVRVLDVMIPEGARRPRRGG